MQRAVLVLGQPLFYIGLFLIVHCLFPTEKAMLAKIIMLLNNIFSMGNEFHKTDRRGILNIGNKEGAVEKGWLLPWRGAK